MPGLILHTGPQGPYYYFKEQVYKLLPEQPESFLYLLPVNRAVRYLARLLVQNAPGNILIEPQIFTFHSLSRYLYQFVPRPGKIIPRTMRLILISQILREEGRGLAYFKNQLPLNSGFINRIDQMLDEFCEFGYQPGDFGQPPPTCREKYKDFGLILASLHKKYNGQLLDERGVIVQSIHNLNHDLFRKVFPRVNHIFISGYGIYTPPMLEFMKKTRDWCRVEVKLEYNGQNQELFSHTRQAFEDLENLAAEVAGSDSGSDPLFKHFFKTALPVKPDINDCRCSVRILKNKEQEVYFIAAAIKKLHQETGLPLHKFGITFPDLENYAALIRNVFKDSGLAYNLSTGHSLAQSSLVQSYLQVLKTVTQGFDCRQIYELLLSPLIRSDDNPAAVWKRLTGQMRMKYLGKDWQQQMNAYIGRLKNRQGTDQQEADAAYIAATEKMMLHLPALIHSLQTLPASAPAVLLKENYVRVLSELGMLKWLEHDQSFLNRQEQERLYRAFNSFIKLLEQLTWILKFQWQDAAVALSDYYHYLSLLVQQEIYNMREWSNYGVQIMPRLEIQAMECKYLFIGGLLEGNFPRHFRRDIFFNDQERQQMGLTASEDVLAQDRFLFYQLLASGADHIYLTCPRFSEDIELLPSTFIAALRDAGCSGRDSENDTELFALTNSTLPEYLSAAFKAGVNGRQQEWFKSWLALNGLPAAQHWLSGVDSAYRKLNPFGRNRYEGNLRDNPAALQLLRQKFAARSFSITALESYAFCPMQYFLNRILMLEEEEEATDEITALEKGSLVHRILFRFYAELPEQHPAPHPAGRLERLMKIAAEEFDKLPYSGLLWTLEKETYFGREGVPGLWDTFIGVENEAIAASGFNPAHFEVAFGPAGSGHYQDPLSTPRAMTIQRKGKKVGLIGKIDRVDINQQQLLVLDYKISSRVDNIKINDLLAGNSLQLPVYLHVIGRLLPQLTPVAAGYYQVRDADHCRRHLVFTEGRAPAALADQKKVRTLLPVQIDGREITMQDLISRSLDYVVDYAESICAGDFRHTSRPEDERCQKYCPYNKICRKDVSKLKTAPGAAADGKTEIH